MRENQGLLVGCSTGNLKYVNLADGSVETVDGSCLDSENAISFIRPTYTDDKFLVLTKSRRLDTLNTRYMRLTRGQLLEDDTSNAVVAFCKASDRRFATCSDRGLVNLWSLKNRRLIRKEDYVLDTKCCSSVSQIVAGGENIIAVGAKASNLKLWDIETKEIVFKARNPPDNKLGLSVPVDVIDLLMLDDNNRTITATLQAELQLFDPLDTSRRPCLIVKTGMEPLNTLAASTHVMGHIYTADTTGAIQLFDLRNPRTCVGKYKGCHGSVRKLIFHENCESPPLLLSASIDNFCRAFNATNRTLVWEAYVKSKINDMVIATKNSSPRVGEAGEALLQEQLQQIVDQAVSKRDRTLVNKRRSDRNGLVSGLVRPKKSKAS